MRSIVPRVIARIGMGAFAHGALGRIHRPGHGAAVRADYERLAAPGDGYRGCLGIIRLAGKYSIQRVEAAAERALLTGACRYKSVESILKNSLDQVPPSSPPPATTPPHDNIRGSEYFE